MILKAGDVRQKGDQVRRDDIGPVGYECHGTLSTFNSSSRSPDRCVHWHEPRTIRPGPWEPVKLLGHPILQSDLMHSEFRRGE